MRALSIAASGMSAQQTNVEVIANNIANTNTVGFKRSSAQFADLLYQTEKPAGAPSRSGGETVPEAMQIGLGVQTIGIRALHIQGPLNATGNQLDLALNGRGWFQISGPNNVTLYTRAGNFSKNATGQLVTVDGSLVIPNITFPANTTNIQVNPDGTVYADNGTGTMTQVGQITIANFANDGGLTALGHNLFQETTSSGAPQIAAPASQGYGSIQQGYLESSNVDPVLEITNLISAQRNYEMNSKVIQATDEMYQVITKNNL
jgi:flagellar basal-body rod protein FlgG